MGFQVGGVGSADVRTAETSEDVTLQLVVRRVRFKSVDSGLFIAEATLAPGGQNALPAVVAAYKGDSGSFVIKGTSPGFVSMDPVGSTMSCRGRWVVDPTYGPQFDVLVLQEVVPTTPEALRKYLGSGRLKGIGPATADEMVNRWGVEVLSILDNTPERLQEISGLTPTKVAIISNAWKDKKTYYRLVSFLGAHGIGEGKALKIQETLGPLDLESRIRENPYVLTEVEGVGFKTADQVAMSLGFTPSCALRINAALQHILMDRIQNDGHTAVPAAEWVGLAAAELLRPREEIQKYCQALIDEQKVVLRQLPVAQKEKRYGNEEWVTTVLPCASPIRVAAQENSIAKSLTRLSGAHSPLGPEDSEVARQTLEDPARNLDPSQKSAAWTALNAPISVITGGPGTGKTTTLRTLVEILRLHGERVVLAAPTGRAAKRMAEAIGEEAKTMHRCLGFKPGKGFECNASNPMQGSVFIVDETSMVDTAMMAAWLSALPTGARMVMVGDADQLPSVGPGDVLKTLIQSGAVPVARLTKVHRQVEGSGIAWNAKRVLEGHAPTFDGNPWSDDFAFLRTEDNMGIQTRLLEVIDGYLEQGIRPQDIQVLSPQKTGDVGVLALNSVLRWKLNPEKPEPIPTEEAPRFMTGERVLQTKNNYDLEVFNGDLGTITKIKDDESMTVEMEDGRTVEYPKAATRDLQLGYAITVHKSQGGERPVILFVCSASHTFMLNRNLMYTGITRGRNKVVMVGSARTAVMAAKKRDELVRTTGLGHEVGRVFRSQPRASARP